MSNEIIVPFDETLRRLPSSLALYAQLRANFTSEDYQQLHVCGIIRKTGLETIVIALAAYRYYLSTYDTVRFEIDDLIVDEKERNHGLGTRLLHYLIDQAKQHGVTQILVHCDPTNTNAHRFFFRAGLTIMVFEFDLRNFQLLPSNDQIRVIDITDVPEKENQQLLIQIHEIYRQLRPHLPTDQEAYIKQIRDICRTGPARILIAISNDEILGLALYRVTRNVNYSTHIYCDDLVTNENKRSSGVGRCLINYMKNEGEKLGIDRLILDSGCQRGRAHRFYYREGFIISQFGFSMLI
jgi:GNAT superfamily N-acetyltransferase